MEIIEILKTYMGCNWKANSTEDDMPIDYIGKLVKVDLEGDVSVIIGDYEYFPSEDDLKPILRNLKSLKFDELVDYIKTFDKSVEINKSEIKEAIMMIQRDGIKAFNINKGGLTEIALMCQWFTEREFDIYGLIESGIAIEKGV